MPHAVRPSDALGWRRGLWRCAVGSPLASLSLVAAASVGGQGGVRRFEWGGRVGTRVLLLFVLVALLLPGGASAATVKVEAHGNGLLFRAAAGETNTVTIEVGSSETMVSDSTAPLAAGERCSPLDPHRVRCIEPSLSWVHTVAVELGDGDDTLRAAFPADLPGLSDVALLVDGGAGRDLLDASRVSGGGPARELSGGPGWDTLIGSPSHEWLLGGPDADVVRAGGGDDDLSGDGPWRRGRRGADLLDGGAGNDVVSYAERLAPVVVDLASGRGGGPGESDRLQAIERVGAGRGRDRIFGDDGPNKLTNVGTIWHWPLTGASWYLPQQVLYAPSAPQAGEVLVGRGGDDTLTPSLLGGRLDGGPGDDLLSRASRRFPFACGRGNDTLQRREEVLVPADCEYVIAADGWVSRGELRGGRAHFRLYAADWIPACPGSVSLSAPDGSRYGGASWAARPKQRQVSFALNAAGREAARRHQIAVVRAVCRGWLAGVTQKVPWRIRLESSPQLEPGPPRRSPHSPARLPAP